MSAGRVTVGRLAGVYGIKGWLRVQSFTQPLENILDYAPWFVEDRGQVKVTEGRPHGKGLIVHLDGVDDRDIAAGLTGRAITVDRSELPELTDGEYYWEDLIGLSVVNRDGEALGKVVRLMETGAHDVLITEGERERLIPYAPGQVVDSVSLGDGIIVVDWGADY